MEGWVYALIAIGISIAALLAAGVYALIMWINQTDKDSSECNHLRQTVRGKVGVTCDDCGAHSTGNDATGKLTWSCDV